jgi:CRISPR-associated exonuclease Cas4
MAEPLSDENPKPLLYDEDDLLPVSALQHLLFCERRAALICLEGQWQDNVFTAEGSLLHEQAHRAETECRGNLRIARSVWLKSLSLGLCGRADVIEFQLVENPEPGKAVHLPGTDGLWQPFPVEYKRGRLRREKSFSVQVCAQALCLEEMLGISISSGALYYGKTRRRLEVPLDDTLREETRHAGHRLHELVSAGITPAARPQAKCHSCSMVDVCLPAAMSRKRNVRRYLQEAIACHEIEQ